MEHIYILCVCYISIYMYAGVQFGSHKMTDLRIVVIFLITFIDSFSITSASAHQLILYGFNLW